MDCPRCGGEIQESEAAFCPHCGSRLFAGPGGGSPSARPEETPPGDRPDPAPPLVPPPEGAEPGPGAAQGEVPFEDPSLSFPSRLLGTVRAALFQPGALFARLSPGGLGAPLLYGLIVGVLGWIFWGLWYSLAVHDSTVAMARRILPDLQDSPLYGPVKEVAESLPSKAEVWSEVLLSPLVVLVALFVATFLIHLTLVLLGGGERGFRVSFRAVCYGATPFLLLLVPFCGHYIAWIWSLVLVAVGLAHGHRSAGWQAAFAVIISVIFGCCLWLGLGALPFLRGQGLGG